MSETPRKPDATEPDATESDATDALRRARGTRVVVVGGGLAGLVAAYEWAKIGAAVTVIEASDRLGGAIETAALDGLPVDLVADTLPLTHPAVAALIDDLDLRDAVEEGVARSVWVTGLPGAPGAAPLPTDTLFGIPANPWAEDVRAVIGGGGAWRAYLDRLRPPLTIGHERSLGRLVRTRLGDRVADRLVAPMTRGVHGVGIDEIDVDAAAPGLSSALTRVGSLTGAVGALREDRPRTPRTTLRGGLGVLVDALARRLADFDVALVTGEPVERMERIGDAWAVQAAPRAQPDPPGDQANGIPSGTARTADVVVLATDAAHASTLLETAGIAIPRPAERDHAPTPAPVVVTLVVAAPPLDAAPRGRAVYPVDPAAAPASGLVHATAEWPGLAVAAGPGRHVLRVTLADGAATRVQTEDEAISEASRAAAELLGTPVGDIRAAAVRRPSWAPPATRIGHTEQVAQVRARIATAPGLAAVGGWLAGSGTSQVIADAIEEVDRHRSAALWGARTAVDGRDPRGDADDPGRN